MDKKTKRKVENKVSKLINAFWYDDTKFDILASELGLYQKDYFNLFLRDKWIEEVGFVLFGSVYLTRLAAYISNKQAIEVCAGSGYLSKKLQSLGINIIATDIKNVDRYRERILQWDKKYYTDIEEMDAMSALNKYNPEIVIASWIDYEDELDIKIYKWCKKRKVPFVLIGELGLGCTGSYEFDYMIDREERDKQVIITSGYDKLGIDVFSFDMIHDETMFMEFN